MRSAVVGIGQALRVDDEAGCAVARGLLARGQTPEAVLILEAGAAPENVTGLLRRHRPRLVVLVDAAEMQAVNGLAAVLSVAAPQTAAPTTPVA